MQPEASNLAHPRPRSVSFATYYSDIAVDIVSPRLSATHTPYQANVTITKVYGIHTLGDNAKPQPLTSIPTMARLHELG